MTHVKFQNKPGEIDAKHAKATALEKEAFEFRDLGQIEKAFTAYDEAGNIFSGIG